MVNHHSGLINSKLKLKPKDCQFGSPLSVLWVFLLLDLEKLARRNMSLGAPSFFLSAALGPCFHESICSLISPCIRTTGIFFCHVSMRKYLWCAPSTNREIRMQHKSGKISKTDIVPAVGKHEICPRVSPELFFTHSIRISHSWNVYVCLLISPRISAWNTHK